MVRFPTLVAASFAIVITTAAYAHAAPESAAPNSLIAQVAGKPLTISAAKSKVTQWLSATGFSQLHTGEAEFDHQGNVKVEVLNGQGTMYTHVLVHAADGTITDARAGVSTDHKG